MAKEWIPVGALGDAFEVENNCLPTVGDLVGRTVVLHSESGGAIEYRFMRDGELCWRILEGHGAGEEGRDAYAATRPREGVYFVDFVKHAERSTSVTLLLDFPGGVFLAVVGRLPTAAEARVAPLERIERKGELTAVTATFLRGTVDVPFNDAAALPQPTCDLVGKRIEYRYSETERYEHIYLNPHFYTWHCLEGSEQGLADTDACHYYRVGPELYLFAWREKIIPTLGVVIVDLRAMKTTGKILGYEDNETLTGLRNFAVGARANVVGGMPRA